MRQGGTKRGEERWGGGDWHDEGGKESGRRVSEEIEESRSIRRVNAEMAGVIKM